MVKLPGPFDSYSSWKLFWALVLGAIVVVVIFLPLDVHVVNGTGEPVSGAVIELFSANRESVAKTVTQDGKARLPVVWPGRYGVLVTADGYRDFDWTVDTSRVDHHLTGLRIVLRS